MLKYVSFLFLFIPWTLSAQVFDNLSDPQLIERFATQTRNILVQKIIQLHQNFIVRGEKEEIRFYTRRQGGCLNLSDKLGTREKRIAKIEFESHLNKEGDSSSRDTYIKYYACDNDTAQFEESILRIGKGLKEKSLQDYILQNLSFDLAENEDSFSYQMHIGQFKGIYRVLSWREGKTKFFRAQIYGHRLVDIIEQKTDKHTLITIQPYDLNLVYPQFNFRSNGLTKFLRIEIDNITKSTLIYEEGQSQPISISRAQSYIASIYGGPIVIFEDAFKRRISLFPSTEVVQTAVGDSKFFTELLRLQELIVIGDLATARIFVDKLVNDIRNGNVGITEKQ